MQGMQVGGMGLDGRGRQLPDHMHIRPGCGLHSRSGGGEADGLAKTVPRQDGICLGGQMVPASVWRPPPAPAFGLPLAGI